MSQLHALISQEKTSLRYGKQGKTMKARRLVKTKISK